MAGSYWPLVPRSHTIRLVTYDVDELYRIYVRKFDKDLGRLEPGQFARWQRTLVERLDRDDFEARWREFKDYEKVYKTLIEDGATVTNALYDEIKEKATQLLLQESGGDFWW